MSRNFTWRRINRQRVLEREVEGELNRLADLATLYCLLRLYQERDEENAREQRLRMRHEVAR